MCEGHCCPPRRPALPAAPSRALVPTQLCWAVSNSTVPWAGFQEVVISRLSPKSKWECVQRLEVAQRLLGLPW